MFFCSGKPHPCERDVDIFLENVKVKLKSKPNVDQHPKCTDDAILPNKLVIVILDNYSETQAKEFKFLA